MSKTLHIMLADLAHTHSVGNASLPIPLNIGFLKAHCMAVHPVGVTIDLFKHPEELLAAAVATPPDILGFTNYGWNENINLKIGTWLKQRLPRTTFIAGGPNIDPAADRRLDFLTRHAYLDYLVIDSGEEPLAEFIAWTWEGSGDKTRLPQNFAWREDGRLIATPERHIRNKRIEGIPSPYLAGYLDKFIELGMVPMFESNRGCPFQCTFCAWGSASKDLVRQFELDTILAEIDYVGKRSTARNWIFCDANFGMLKRDVEIAQAIRKVRDTTGFPKKCHIWLAKNATERNLVIGEILGDMTVPVMAVQSLNEPTLKAIKRSNISADTYVSYQQKFHRMGSRTYSDTIVPLPEETLASHLAGLRTLLELGVDVIANHNMRLLAGAESNSAETRERYAFHTRYRIIHGDAGRYRTPDGGHIDAFEYEESLRATNTFPEAELFYLRKLHFLVDIAWNSRVYKPILNLLLAESINPLDVLMQLLERATRSDDGVTPSLTRVKEFFARFEQDSQGEWFDSRQAIEDCFAQEKNFSRLINQEFEKLNIQYSIILLRDYKQDFDEVLRDILASLPIDDRARLDDCVKLAYSLFPPLNVASEPIDLSVPADAYRFFRRSTQTDEPAQPIHGTMHEIRLTPRSERDRMISIIADPKGVSISKILNTQGYWIDDLGFTLAEANA